MRSISSADREGKYCEFEKQKSEAFFTGNNFSL